MDLDKVAYPAELDKYFSHQARVRLGEALHHKRLAKVDTFVFNRDAKAMQLIRTSSIAVREKRANSRWKNTTTFLNDYAFLFVLCNHVQYLNKTYI